MGVYGKILSMSKAGFILSTVVRLQTTHCNFLEKALNSLYENP